MTWEQPRITLNREDGSELRFAAPNEGERMWLIYGSTGLGIAPATIEAAPVLAGHGSILKGRRLDEREIFIPLVLEAPTMTELDEVRAELMRFVSPLDESALTLRVTPPGDGPYREIPVYYAGGLDGDFGDGYHGTHQTIGLKFKALAALWYGEPISVQQQTNPGSKPFLSTTKNFFPVMLAGSTVTGEITLDVAGDAPTFPVWRVTPPGEDFRITRRGSPERFYIDGLMTQGYEIDMEAGTVRDTSGADLWGRVSLDSTMFALPPGVNVLNVAMVNATEASMIEVSYRPRYLAAL